MKKLILFIIAFLIFAPAVIAQSVKVMSKKVTYKRPKPSADFKKSFIVTYPKISGVGAALAKKIETTISFEKNTNFNLKEELGEFQWLEEASYEVKYNKNGLLDIILFAEGSAAYPSLIVTEVVVDLKTGNRVKPADIFIKLTELAKFVKKAQVAEIKKAKVDIKKENPEEELESLFENANFTVENLAEFAVHDKGVTFIYNYAFPHVALALQPEGRFSYTWAQIKPFIKRDGLFAKFVK